MQVFIGNKGAHLILHGTLRGMRGHSLYRDHATTISPYFFTLSLCFLQLLRPFLEGINDMTYHYYAYLCHRHLLLLYFGWTTVMKKCPYCSRDAFKRCHSYSASIPVPCFEEHCTVTHKFCGQLEALCAAHSCQTIFVVQVCGFYNATCSLVEPLCPRGISLPPLLSLC